MKNKTLIAILCVVGTAAAFAGCATTTRTTIRQYEYSDQTPDRQNPASKGEYEMVSPGKMISPGTMVSPTDPPLN